MKDGRMHVSTWMIHFACWPMHLHVLRTPGLCTLIRTPNTLVVSNWWWYNCYYWCQTCLDSLRAVVCTDYYYRVNIVLLMHCWGYVVMAVIRNNEWPFSKCTVCISKFFGTLHAHHYKQADRLTEWLLSDTMQVFCKYFATVFYELGPSTHRSPTISSPYQRLPTNHNACNVDRLESPDVIQYLLWHVSISIMELIMYYKHRFIKPQVAVWILLLWKK